VTKKHFNIHNPVQWLSSLARKLGKVQMMTCHSFIVLVLTSYSNTKTNLIQQFNNPDEEKLKDEITIPYNQFYCDLEDTHLQVCPPMVHYMEDRAHQSQHNIGITIKISTYLQVHPSMVHHHQRAHIFSFPSLYHHIT